MAVTIWVLIQATKRYSLLIKPTAKKVTAQREILCLEAIEQESSLIERKGTLNWFLQRVLKRSLQLKQFTEPCLGTNYLTDLMAQIVARWRATLPQKTRCSNENWHRKVSWPRQKVARSIFTTRLESSLLSWALIERRWFSDNLLSIVTRATHQLKWHFQRFFRIRTWAWANTLSRSKVFKEDGILTHGATRIKMI